MFIVIGNMRVDKDLIESWYPDTHRKGKINRIVIGCTTGDTMIEDFKDDVTARDATLKALDRVMDARPVLKLKK